MRISYRWLKKFLNFEISAHDLVATISRGAVQVQKTIDLGYGGEPILIGEIVELSPHPRKSSLKIARIATGEGPVLESLADAPNLKIGQRVVVALPGAHLASGLVFAEKTVDGQRVECRICTGAELGWNSEENLALILSEDYPVGQPFDYLMELNVPPNRPDCLSVFGVARDVAANFNKKVYLQTIRFSEALDHTESFVSVSIKAREQVPRYAGRYLMNLRIGESPLWLQLALESANYKSQNNVQDIINYIMLELGQPLMVYDMDKVANKQIIVRRAEDGETVQLLDGSTVELTSDDLVVADPTKILSLCGIMGARGSDVTESSANIFIESAYFDPTYVRRTADRLNLSSDLSYRHTRGTDRGALAHPVNQASAHIKELAGGEVSKGNIDINAWPAQNRPVGVSLRRMNRMLGLDLKGREVADILVALGFEILHFDHDTMMVNVPTYRADVHRDVDLIEEVARLHGYEKIPVTAPYIKARPVEIDIEAQMERKSRAAMSWLGFYEIITYSFISQREIESLSIPLDQCILLQNPLSQEQAIMRPTMTPSMLSAIRHNLNRGNRDLRLFEIGHTYRRTSSKEREERLKLIGAMCGTRSWHWREQKREIDYYDIKGIAEQFLGTLGLDEFEVLPDPPNFLHPGRSARVGSNGVEIGWLGELHPELIETFELRSRVYLLEVDLKGCMRNRSAIRQFEDIPKFPPAERDMALLVDKDVTAYSVEELVRQVNEELLEDCRLFDVFTEPPVPARMKSLNFKLVYRSHERTLTDEEIDELQEKTLAALEERFGAKLRDQ